MINPSFILCCIYPRINLTIYGVHAEAWDPFGISFSRAQMDHGGPVWTEMPYSMYECRKVAVRFFTTSGILTSVFICLEEKMDIRDGTLWISLTVALAVATRSSLVVTVGGG